MAVQGMKQLIALSLFAAVSVLGAGFPVFFGTQNDYISNDGKGLVIVCSNSVIARFTGNPRTWVFTNNSSDAILAIDNGSAATQLAFRRNGGEAFRISITTAGMFRLLDASNALATVMQYDPSVGQWSLPLTPGGGITLNQDGSGNLFYTNNPINVATPNQVLGVGGANTNFTFQASDTETHVDAGTTNVNIVAIMGGTSSISWTKHVVFTNRTATSRTISFSSTTNSWVAAQEYDGVTNAGPITVTNFQAVYMWLKVRGSNVLYAYKNARNPAN